MQRFEIHVDVPRDLNAPVRFEVQGVKGGSCRNITRGLEEALGGEKLSDEVTGEFYEQSIRQDLTRFGGE